MFALLCLLLPPMASCALSFFFARGKRPDFRSLCVSFLLDALVIQLTTLALLFPLNRASIVIQFNFLPVPLWGKTAFIFMLILGVLLGLLHARFSWQITEGSIEGRSLRPRLSAFLLILGSCGLRWGLAVYQNVSFEEIWFYLCMPLQGTSRSFSLDLLLQVFLPAVVIDGLGHLLLRLLARRPRSRVFSCGRLFRFSLRPLRASLALRRGLMFLWLFALLGITCDYLSIPSFISSRIHHSTLIEETYVDPSSVTITFPEQKRNLIWICMESAETTCQDTASGGVLSRNLIPEMTRLAQENTSFSQSDLIQGAAIAPACGWTISGMVAQTAGLPLKLYGYDDSLGGTDNVADQFLTFLPGATTLGDILKEEGYRNVFMAGSDFTFGGRRLYFTQHGDYEIWDLLTAREEGKIPENYYVGWGFQDVDLYAFAKEKLSELSQGDQPFSLCLLTVDTHDPCFICPLCDRSLGDRFEMVTACSSAQVADFVAWCQTQPFYEDTTIVITGDHASMISTYYADMDGESYDKHSGSTNRLVYNAFINSAVEPVQEKNRLFCTLDFFPTMLASMGVSIEGERLGLGTNLFSDAETLCEQYGYEDLFTELNKKSLFYNSEILYP